LTTDPSGASEPRRILPAGRLDRRLPRHHDVLPGPLLDARPDLTERAAVDAAGAPVGDSRADELARDQPDTAGLVHVGRDVAAARLQVGDDRGAAGDGVEVLELERDADLAGDREQVEHAVRRAARARDRGNRVLERLAGQDLRRAGVGADELHRELARLVSRRRLRRMLGGDAGGRAG
jgi:hypothetical protein